MKPSKYLFLSLAFLLSFTTGALTVSLINCRRALKSVNRALYSIPLRDDQRKQYYLKTDASVQQLLFLDDTALLYLSGNTLRRRALRGSRPETVFQGHTGPIQAVQLSADRKRVITSSTDGTLRLWDTRSGACLAISETVDTTVQPRWTLLHELVFHPDGKTIRSADMEGFKTWRVSDLKLITSEESDLLYMCTGLLSPDWETLCIPVLEEGFQVVNCRDGEMLEYIGEKSPLAFSPDGRRILAANQETGTMEIWNIDHATTGERRSVLWLYSPNVPLRDAAFSPDGSQLVSAHGDGTVRIWNTLNGAEREILHWDGHKADGVCFSPDGTRVAAYDTDAREICIWGPISWMN